MEVTLIINGNRYSVSAEPDEMLLNTLRKLGFKSVKKGCDSTSCGVCNIHVDGKVVPSCAFLTVRADHREITTLEGLQERAKEIAAYVTAEGAEQCGYCSPGNLMTLMALFNENENPTMEEVKHFLAGNLCRCSGYEGQHRGIAKYLEVKKA